MDFQDKDGAMTTLHDHTYGITSDPLTQFSCVLSALIHDACHSGVTNAQLIKENNALASKYKNQSIAEQFSLDVSWNLLMEPDYANLRAAIYVDETEMRRFR
jgi:3'5'-cyclic nucleotide phosphodiesterase